MADNEIAFCMPGTDPEVIRLRTSAVPRKDEIVQVRRVDYQVRDVYWTIDYPDERNTSLRITVQLKEREYGLG